MPRVITHFRGLTIWIVSIYFFPTNWQSILLLEGTAFSSCFYHKWPLCWAFYYLVPHVFLAFSKGVKPLTLSPIITRSIYKKRIFLSRPKSISSLGNGKERASRQNKHIGNFPMILGHFWLPDHDLCFYHFGYHTCSLLSMEKRNRSSNLNSAVQILLPGDLSSSWIWTTWISSRPHYQISVCKEGSW